MRGNHSTAETIKGRGNGDTNRRRRRKSFIPSLIVRMVVITALVVGTSLISWTALTNVGRPYIIGAQQAAEISEKTQTLQKLESDNASLSRQRAFLSRPDGIQYEARLKGYLLPGERSLILTTPPQAGQ